jgi:tetrapyrrole methylase family protein/MazG family protein
MKEFDKLVDLIEYLLGPKGCPWDREQTVTSIRNCVTEEAAELVDAIDSGDNAHILEELGDLLFVALFLAKLAEKEERCTLEKVIEGSQEKLERRHPHVFGNAQLDMQNWREALHTQWLTIKKQEEALFPHKNKPVFLPKGLPALAKAQKLVKKMEEMNIEKVALDHPQKFATEEELGMFLLAVASSAQQQGWDAEHALRTTLQKIESTLKKTTITTPRTITT